MRTTLRAAAVAAVALSLCAAAGYTAPSFASEAEAGPASSYIEHASIMLPSESFGLNELLGSGPASPDELSSSTPVAAHAMAPALPAPAAEPSEALEGLSLAELVREFTATEASDEETDCLARAVYYESKGEPLAGQLTVAEVVINRARSGRFPSTICDVVRQPGQFSFVRRGHIPTPPAGSSDWRTAVAIAEVATRELADGAAPQALFFHARHVRPGWRLTRVATVGNHIFYR